MSRPGLMRHLLTGLVLIAALASPATRAAAPPQTLDRVLTPVRGSLARP